MECKSSSCNFNSQICILPHLFFKFFNLKMYVGTLQNVYNNTGILIIHECDLICLGGDHFRCHFQSGGCPPPPKFFFPQLFSQNFFPLVGGGEGPPPIFRWFKFTLKPPIVVARDNLRLAIWDISFWTFFVKFGHRTP